jgi:hypothetical protein
MRSKIQISNFPQLGCLNISLERQYIVIVDVGRCEIRTTKLAS